MSDSKLILKDKVKLRNITRAAFDAVDTDGSGKIIKIS